MRGSYSQLVGVLDGKDADVVCHMRQELDVLRARHMVAQLLHKHGVGESDSTRFVTAVSEICVNAVRYAGRGVLCAWRRVSARDVIFVVKVGDEGPGIEDIRWALVEQNSSVGSLGLGLPGARRLVDEMKIVSPLPGKRCGTLVTLKMLRRV